MWERPAFLQVAINGRSVLQATNHDLKSPRKTVPLPKLFSIDRTPKKRIKYDGAAAMGVLYRPCGNLPGGPGNSGFALSKLNIRIARVAFSNQHSAISIQPKQGIQRIATLCRPNSKNEKTMLKLRPIGALKNRRKWLRQTF